MPKRKYSESVCGYNGNSKGWGNIKDSGNIGRHVFMNATKEEETDKDHSNKDNRSTI